LEKLQLTLIIIGNRISSGKKNKNIDNATCVIAEEKETVVGRCSSQNRPARAVKFVSQLLCLENFLYEVITNLQTQLLKGIYNM
jgi:hypothetical protein